DRLPPTHDVAALHPPERVLVLVDAAGEVEADGHHARRVLSAGRGGGRGSRLRSPAPGKAQPLAFGGRRQVEIGERGGAPQRVEVLEIGRYEEIGVPATPGEGHAPDLQA